VHEDFRPAEPRALFGQDHPPADGFSVLHTSTSDRERKGTVALLKAWGELLFARRLPRDSMLTLLLDRPAAAVLYDQLEDAGYELPSRVRIMSRLGNESGAEPRVMANWYGGQHVICQPSRGEGFGMVPLEARASGVPIVATSCTGHSEHISETSVGEGIIVVKTGELAPMDDVPGAMAPALAPNDVADALEQAYACWGALHEGAMSNADRVREQWSWERKLAPLVRRLEA
jgi:glycosyltransferase involved in cell wall biosynthesis